MYVQSLYERPDFLTSPGSLHGCLHYFTHLLYSQSLQDPNDAFISASDVPLGFDCPVWALLLEPYPPLASLVQQPRPVALSQ